MTTPQLARLGLIKDCHSSWCGQVGDWLQLDLGQERSISSLDTQGAPDDFGFVKKFTLSYQNSPVRSWKEYKELGESNAKVWVVTISICCNNASKTHKCSLGIFFSCMH